MPATERQKLSRMFKMLHHSGGMVIVGFRSQICGFQLIEAILNPDPILVPQVFKDRCGALNTYQVPMGWRKIL